MSRLHRLDGGGALGREQRLAQPARQARRRQGVPGVGPGLCDAPQHGVDQTRLTLCLPAGAHAGPRSRHDAVGRPMCRCRSPRSRAAARSGSQASGLRRRWGPSIRSARSAQRSASVASRCARARSAGVEPLHRLRQDLGQEAPVRRHGLHQRKRRRTGGMTRLRHRRLLRRRLSPGRSHVYQPLRWNKERRDGRRPRPADDLPPEARRALAEAEARRATGQGAGPAGRARRPRRARNPSASATGRRRASPTTSETRPHSRRRSARSPATFVGHEAQDVSLHRHGLAIVTEVLTTENAACGRNTGRATSSSRWTDCPKARPPISPSDETVSRRPNRVRSRPSMMVTKASRRRTGMKSARAMPPGKNRARTSPRKIAARNTPGLRDAYSRGSLVASAQPQNVQHVVCARLPVLPPERGLERAAGEDRAVGGDVAQHDPLARAGEDHVMLAHDVAAADGGKADVRRARARAGDAVAARGRRPRPARRRAPRPRPRPASARCPRARRPCGGDAPRRSRCRSRRPAPRATWRVSWTSRLTPRLMLPARTMHRVARGGVDAVQIVLASDPVVPITCTARACAASSANATVAAGAVKSITACARREGLQRVVGHRHAQRRAAHGLAHVAPDPGVPRHARRAPTRSRPVAVGDQSRSASGPSGPMRPSPRCPACSLIGSASVPAALSVRRQVRRARAHRLRRAT